jgi:hypothetical protein
VDSWQGSNGNGSQKTTSVLTTTKQKAMAIYATAATVMAPVHGQTWTLVLLDSKQANKCEQFARQGHAGHIRSNETLEDEQER